MQNLSTSHKMDKKIQKHRKVALIEARGCKIMMLLMIMFISISMISALDFSIDNYKVYGDKIGDYGKISIWDTGQIAEDKILSEITLEKNTDQCLINCESSGTTILYIDGKLFSDMKFENKKEKSVELDYTIYYLGEVIEKYTVGDYNEECSIAKNNTEVCEQIKIGEHEEEQIFIRWIEYKGEILEAGNYEWKIKGKKDKNEAIDWIGSSMGIELSDWAWWDGDWSYRKEIDIEGGAGILTNFPILINITYDANMQSDFDDIRFVDGTCDGVQDTEIPYEIDTKTNSNYAMAWVLIPSLSTGTDNVCMYYGNAGASNGQDRESVWIDYSMVYHFNNEGATLMDSSSTRLNLTAVGDPIVNSSGYIGNSYTFDGDDYFASLGSATPHTATVSVSAWAQTPQSSPAGNEWISQFISGTGGTAVGGIAQYLSSLDYKIAHDTANDAEALFDSGLNFIQNQYVHLGGDWEDGDQQSYLNGVPGNALTDTGAWTYKADGEYYVGDWSNNVLYGWNGEIDELRVSSVARGDNWFAREYQISNFTKIVFGAEEESVGVSAIQNYPIDGYNTTDNTVDISCNFTREGSSTIAIVKLDVYDSSNNLDYTNTESGLSLLSYNKTWTTTALTDDYYNWSCFVTGDGAETGSAGNRTLTVDTTYPVINIINPIADIITTNAQYNVSFNWTVVDTNLANCWYYNNTANVSSTCGENATIQLNSGSTYTLFAYANDSAGNERGNSTTFLLNSLTTTYNYTDPIIEGETYIYSLNISATNITTWNGTLYYNGTAQTTIRINNATRGSLSSTLTAPQVTATINKNLYWSYMINEIWYNSTAYTQLVQNIPAPTLGASCSAGTEPAMNFTFKNELNATTYNGNIKYILRYGVSNSSQVTVNGTVSDVPSFVICINSTIYNNYTIGYGELQYSRTGFADRRWYIFNNERLSNITVNNILHLITGANSFLFTIQDSGLSPYEGAYLSLNRWYPSIDEYKVVEMAKTDDKGQTVMKVEVEDTDYRVGVYNPDGTLIYLASPLRFVCIASPCTYSLTIPDNAGNSFKNWNNLQVSLTYDEPTSVFTLIYNDPSQDTSEVRLEVFKETGTGKSSVCTDSASSYTGVLTCNVSAYTGVLRAVAYRTASPETSIISRMFTKGSDALAGNNGLFITLILMIFLITVGIFSPILTVLLSILALIPALMFGIIPLSIGLVICAMGFIVISFIKRSVGR